MIQTITKSSKQTESFAKKFAKELRPGDILCLEGDLGGGKTTFIKGLAKGLGIKSRITSPTFVLVKKYKINTQHSTFNIQYLYHIDLYRLKKVDDILDLGLEEILQDKNSVIVIEWASRIKKFLPKRRKIMIKFEFVGENERKIMLNKK